MVDDRYKKIWHYIKHYMTGSLRDTDMFLGDETLQKEQYIEHRREIVQHLAQELNARALKERESPETARKLMLANMRDYPFFADLADMGISPEAVFDADLEDSLGESDYQVWKSGGKKSIG